MKNKTLQLLFLCLLFSSCWYSDDGGDPPFTSSFQAQIMSRPEFESSILLQNSKPIVETGKIYVKGDYLFINEPYVGFHILNNSNPSNPIREKFLATPGATDLIFKNSSFYINQAVDLVALKFDASFNNVTETKRVRNIFPELLSPDGFSANTDENDIVVKWIEN